MAAYSSKLFAGCRTLMAAAKSSTSATQKSASGITKPVPVSSQLGKFLGSDKVSRTQAVKQVWEYIKQNNLQNPANKKEVRCDAKLKTIFGQKDTVGFTEIAKLLSQHFVKSA